MLGNKSFLTFNPHIFLCCCRLQCRLRKRAGRNPARLTNLYDIPHSCWFFLEPFFIWGLRWFYELEIPAHNSAIHSTEISSFHCPTCKGFTPLSCLIHKHTALWLICDESATWAKSFLSFLFVPIGFLFLALILKNILKKKKSSNARVEVTNHYCTLKLWRRKKIRFQREWRGIIQKTNQTHSWRTERGSWGLESVHGHAIPGTSGALFGILQSSHVIAKLFDGARNREPLGSTCVKIV